MVDVTSGGKAAPEKLADGDQVFMTCPCRTPDAEPEGFHPMLIRSSGALRVAYLVCRSCNHRAYLDNGILVHSKPIGQTN